MMNEIWSKTSASRIRNAQSSGMWVPCQLFPDWFGLQGSLRDRLKRCWWRSMQSKWEGSRECRNSTTVCVNVSPASLRILNERFIWRYIMGKWWAVAYEYRLKNRCIAGAMMVLARYTNLGRVRENWCKQWVRITCQRAGFGSEKSFGSVPEPSKNPTRWFLVVQTRPRTHQAAGFAGFG